MRLIEYNIVDAPQGSGEFIANEVMKGDPIDFITFWHGTTLELAQKIIKEEKLLPDDLWSIGLSTDKYRGYAGRKAEIDKARPALLEFEVLRKDLQDRRVDPEVGGRGKN